MVEKYIEEHVESEIERDKKIDIDRIGSEYDTLTRTREIIYYGSSIWCCDERKYFTQEIHRLIENIPSIKAEKSTEVDSEYREDHDPRDKNPTLHVMVFFVPIGMKELKRGKSSDETSESWSRDEDDIEMNILRKFPEVDKVRKNIEWIREEKEPKEKKENMEYPFFFHCEHREKVRDNSKYQVPHEPTEDGISCEIGSEECEKPSIETESSIGVEVHRELRKKNYE